MIRRSTEEIKAKLIELWGEADVAWSSPYKRDVDTNKPNLVRVSVSNMYEAPGLSFKILMDLAEFFGTKNIVDVDKFHSGGCETCDYGSESGFTLEIKPEVPA